MLALAAALLGAACATTLAGADLATGGAGVGGVHRSRTDIPREAPVVPPPKPPPSTGADPTTPADLAAARGVTWPLPAACSDPETDEPRGRLPEGTGYGADPASIGPGARLRRVFGIRDGHLTPVDGAGSPGACDLLRWRVLSSALPGSARARLDQLVLYDYPASVLDDPHRTTGVREGFFQPDPADPTRFRIALAVDVSAQDQLLTMAHETGHALSLYPRLPHPVVDADCPWVIDDAGTCADPDTPLRAFYASTYPVATRAALLHAYAGASTPGPDELAALYRAHRDEFVSAYAASHPTEDFAESYAYWCLYGTSTRAPVEGEPRAGLAKRVFFDEEVSSGRMSDQPCRVLRALAARP